MYVMPSPLRGCEAQATATTQTTIKKTQTNISILTPNTLFLEPINLSIASEERKAIAKIGGRAPARLYSTLLCEGRIS